MSEELGGLMDLSNRYSILVHSFPYLHISVLQKAKIDERPADSSNLAFLFNFTHHM